jgi:hypothetical protein
MTTPKPFRIAVLLLTTLAVAGCGSAASSSSSSSAGSGTTTAPSTSTQTTAGPPPAVSELGAAEHPLGSQFPSARGHTLQQLAALVHTSAQLGAATGTFTPGTRRFAFGLNTSSGAFIYAPTAIYLARTPNGPAQGPFLAPADPLSVAPQYRSRQNAGPGGLQAIYATQLPLPSKGTFVVLSLTRTQKGLIGAPGEVAVAATSPIPNVGQHPPAIATDTAASVHGDAALLSTRVPPEAMQPASFKAVLGKRPVALLFSTPQLCISKVCGPVTDIAVELQRQFGNRITFIHEEVYVNNQPTKGLRPQLKAFHLQTEPWLFTVDRHGVIAARLEGSFGVNAFTRALQAALR